MNGEKFNTFLNYGLLFVAVVMGVFFIIKPWVQADRMFVELEYHGIVKSIEYRPGTRGTPAILIDSTWRLLTLDEQNIFSRLAPGDSIVKRKGRSIEIYEKVAERYVLKLDNPN